MTKLTEDQIKKNDLYALKMWHVILIVTFQVITALGAYFTMKADLYNHIDNTDVHMTFEKKVEAFVPRGEYIDLKESLDEFKEMYREDIKELKNMIRDKK